MADEFGEESGVGMMFLPLPVRFDENEWFEILSILLFALVILAVPKRFPAIITVMMLLFNCALSLTCDYTLSAALPYDMYDYNDTHKLDFFDEIMHFLLYPLVGYLFMYWYEVWRENRFRIVFFVPLAAALSTLYEWSSVKAHVFTYKGWKLEYSAISYVILISINIYFLQKMKRWLKKAHRL